MQSFTLFTTHEITEYDNGSRTIQTIIAGKAAIRKYANNTNNSLKAFLTPL